VNIHRPACLGPWAPHISSPSVRGCGGTADYSHRIGELSDPTCPRTCPGLGHRKSVWPSVSWSNLLARSILQATLHDSLPEESDLICEYICAFYAITGLYFYLRKISCVDLCPPSWVRFHSSLQSQTPASLSSNLPSLPWSTQSLASFPLRPVILD
jgi:hypothetical protein